MAAWTLAEAQEKLATWMAADDAIATAQEYELYVGNNKRKLTRADAEMVQKKILFWRKEVERLSSATGVAGPKIRYVNPL